VKRLKKYKNYLNPYKAYVHGVVWKSKKWHNWWHDRWTEQKEDDSIVQKGCLSPYRNTLGISW